MTYARREEKEAQMAEESNPEFAGHFPVIVVDRANHAQVSNGEQIVCMWPVELRRYFKVYFRRSF